MISTHPTPERDTTTMEIDSEDLRHMLKPKYQLAIHCSDEDDLVRHTKGPELAAALGHHAAAVQGPEIPQRGAIRC